MVEENEKKTTEAPETGPAEEPLVDEAKDSSRPGWREIFRQALDKARREHQVTNRRELGRDRSRSLFLLAGAAIAVLQKMWAERHDLRSRLLECIQSLQPRQSLRMRGLTRWEKLIFQIPEGSKQRPPLPIHQCSRRQMTFVSRHWCSFEMCKAIPQVSAREWLRPRWRKIRSCWICPQGRNWLPGSSPL